MITIYSVDSTGRLFTDPKQHFYIDASLLREKAAAVKTVAVLDAIARVFGYRSFASLDAFTRCRGITQDVLLDLIISGKLADVLRRLSE